MAESECLKQLTKELMEKAISTSHKNCSKQLDELCSAIFSGMFAILFKVDQCLLSCLSGELSEPCLGLVVLVRNWHSRAEHPSFTTKPSSLDNTGASFLFLFALSLPVESSTLSLYHPASTQSSLSSQMSNPRSTRLLFFH